MTKQTGIKTHKPIVGVNDISDENYRKPISRRSYIIWNVSHYRWVHMAQFCEWEWKNAEEGTVVTGCTMHGVSFHTYHIMTVTQEKYPKINLFQLLKKGGACIEAIFDQRNHKFYPPKSIAQDP